MKAVFPTLVAIAVILACLRLAFWQLDRADYKAELLDGFDQAPSISLDVVNAETPRYTRVAGRGTFLEGRDVMLDNQVFQMQPGVHVFTPFERHSDGRIFMVNRGWQPLDSSRRAAAAWDTPTDVITLSGLLNEPPEVGFQLGSQEALDSENWPNMMTYYDSELIDEALEGPVDSRVIQLDPDHEAGFAGRDWQPVVFGPERHRAYAFQWFSIALAVFILWLVLFVRFLRKT